MSHPIIQSFLQPLDEQGFHFSGSILFVRGLKNRPRSQLRICMGEHLVIEMKKLIISVPLWRRSSVVTSARKSLRKRAVYQSVFSVPSWKYEEKNLMITVPSRIRSSFKGIDLLIGLRKLKRRKRRIKMIDLYSTIPAAVKDRDLSSGRKLGPETPRDTDASARSHPPSGSYKQRTLGDLKVRSGVR